MQKIHDILRQIQQKKLSVEAAEKLLKLNYLDKIDHMAQLDIFRQARTGIPEVVFAESKSADQIIKITQSLLSQNHYCILTRLQPNHFAVLDQKYSESSQITYQPNSEGRVAFLYTEEFIPLTSPGKVGIITAGTSDIPVAEEVKIVLETMGITTMYTYDIGIAGMHRIFPPLKDMLSQEADVFIVCAGMEGTLPGVVSALVDKPVIGVPTSTGYGLGEKGKGALTTMLQSCSPGLAVVNIDNGFGAATFAALIIQSKYN